MFLHAEEDVGACLDWAGCRGIQSELRYGLTSNGIIMILQGKDNICGILEVLNRGVSW